MESPVPSGNSVYCRQGAGRRAWAALREVRLPQGLRFTDVRRSTLGDFPLARGGSRASKSHGRFELRPSSCLLCPLRLPSAASFFRAHLRNLLDGVFRPERQSCAPAAATRSDAPIWPALDSALCRACRMAPPPFVRAVAYGPYEDRMKAAIHALKYDRLHAAARGLGRMLAEAIAQLADERPARCWWFRCRCTARSTPSAASTRPARWPFMRWRALRKIASGVAAYTGLEHADAPARHREPGRADPAPAPH